MDILSTFPTTPPERMDDTHMTVFERFPDYTDNQYGATRIHMVTFTGEPPRCVRAPIGFKGSFQGLTVEEVQTLISKLGWRCSSPRKIRDLVDELAKR